MNERPRRVQGGQSIIKDDAIDDGGERALKGVPQCQTTNTEYGSKKDGQTNND